MKLIFDYKFRFYTSKLNEICLHCHWLYFSSIIMSFGQGEFIPAVAAGAGVASTLDVGMSSRSSGFKSYRM